MAACNTSSEETNVEQTGKLKKKALGFWALTLELTWLNCVMAWRFKNCLHPIVIARMAVKTSVLNAS